MGSPAPPLPTPLTKASRRLAVLERCFVFPERETCGTSDVVSCAGGDSIRASLLLGKKTSPKACDTGRCVGARQEQTRRSWSEVNPGVSMAQAATCRAGTRKQSALYTPIQSAPSGVVCPIPGASSRLGSQIWTGFRSKLSRGLSGWKTIPPGEG